MKPQQENLPGAVVKTALDPSYWFVDVNQSLDELGDYSLGPAIIIDILVVDVEARDERRFQQKSPLPGCDRMRL